MPVDPYNSSSSANNFSPSSTTNISAISSKILNYHEKIQNGNLQIIDMRYYYEYAICREMTALNNIKTGLQKAKSSRRRMMMEKKERSIDHYRYQLLIITK